ncbi:MAG TPA: hypothetical protein PKI01_10395 [Bacteroidales bacterium]|nr:hypothetical protein [Bacteroidales bacterium]
MNYENFELIDRVEQGCKLWAANNPNWLKDYKARIQMESEKYGNPGSCEPDENGIVKNEKQENE